MGRATQAQHVDRPGQCPAKAAKEPVVQSGTALPWPNMARPGWALQVVFLQPIGQAHQCFVLGNPGKRLEPKREAAHKIREYSPHK